MSPVDVTDKSQHDTVSFEFDLRHPPHKVWRALTDPVLLARWLLPVIDFHPAPGAQFRFEAEPQPGWDGVVGCEMLTVDEPRSISWAWVVGDIETVVTFTLEPTASGTRLSLSQSGFREDQKRNFGGARYGWNMMGERLESLLEELT